MNTLAPTPAAALRLAESARPWPMAASGESASLIDNAATGAAGAGRRRRIKRRLAGFIRLAWRAPALVGLVLASAVDFLLRVRRLEKRARHRVQKARSLWLANWSRRLLRLLNVRVQVVGRPAADGLVVANHLSYLDVLVLASQHPTVFVARPAVHRRLLVGRVAQAAGTVFLDRDNRADLDRLSVKVEGAVLSGTVVALFPEGARTDGRQVLPFFASLLTPALEGGWPATPAWLGYQLDEGDVATEVCYWRDMTFLPHLLNLLTLGRIEATVAYGDSERAAPDRKLIARQLRDAVIRLGNAHGARLPLAGRAPGWSMTPMQPLSVDWRNGHLSEEFCVPVRRVRSAGRPAATSPV